MAEERIQESAKPSASAPAEFTKRRKKTGKEVVVLKEKVAADGPEPHARDSIREVLETIVFVAILVFMLKTFVAEAFIIPTGSMGPSLFGHHDLITCPECGWTWRVNTSKEVDDQGKIEPVYGCTCPNCRYHMFRESTVPTENSEFPRR